MRIALLLLTAVLTAATAAEANEMLRRNACRNDLPPLLWSPQELAMSLPEITAHEERCKGTGLYEEILAKAYIGLGQCDDAISTADAGLAANPVLLDDLYLIRGQGYACVGNWGLAEQSYAKAIADAPTNFTAHWEYSVALYRQNRTPEAIAHLQRTRVEYDNWVINQLLALMLQAQGDCGQAVEAVDRALADRAELISDRPLVLTGIQCNTLIGHYDAADRLVNRFIEANPGLRQDPQVRQAIEDLNRRRGG